MSAPPLCYSLAAVQCDHSLYNAISPVMMVNDELLQRLTNKKTSLNKPLVIHRSSETSVPLDYHSPPEEVAEWLQGKGFSEP